MPVPTEIKRHAWWEDGLALPVGAFLMSWGIVLLYEIEGVTGGVTGVAFLLTYATGWKLGLVLFAVNLPFYFFAVRRMGWGFTIKTITAVTLIATGTALHPLYIDIGDLRPMYAAIFAGLAVGAGMLILFRHGASAGGFGIVALYVQERWGIRAGYVQGVLDVVVVLGALAFVEPFILVCSLVGALVLNVVLAINHRPGRYYG